MSGFIATETEMAVIATQPHPGAPFEVKLIRAQTTWYDDGDHECSEDVVGQHQVRVPLPLLFEVANDWLLDDYHLAALPHSWRITAADKADALILAARAVPAASVAAEGAGHYVDATPAAPSSGLAAVDISRSERGPIDSGTPLATTAA